MSRREPSTVLTALVGDDLARKVTMATTPFATLRRLALDRGLRGGSRTWLVVGGVVWGLRLVRLAATRREEFVTLERLRPGESIQIRALERPQRGRA